MKTYNIYQELFSDFPSEYQVIEDFNSKIKQLFKCQYSLGVTTGTEAIEIALKALELPLGSAVIVPEISFIATATAVANCGLVPVFADIDEDFYGLSYDDLVKTYTEEIQCVIVVHFAGFVNRDIYKIRDFCREKGIALVEDCAQAFGAAIDGHYVGTIGDIGTFSLQSSKLLNSGEGGIIITNRADLNTKCEQIMNWGLPSDGDREMGVASSNFRLSAIQCYLILKQLAVFDTLFKRRLELIDEAKSAAEKYKLTPAFPAPHKNIVDCPFFFPLESTVKHNTVEPRPECPMSNSTIVVSIFKTFFPDLLARYRELNSHTKNNVKAGKVIKNIDFIIHSLIDGEQSRRETLSQYENDAKNIL